MLIWRILGGLAFAVGAVGIVLPVMPTTIFWILAALCFARSDPKVRDWIYARPGIGPQVELFLEHGQMTKAGKRGALTGMALGAGILFFFFHARPLVLGIGFAITALGAGLVLSRKTGEV